MIETRNVLKKYFGYDNFRTGQEELINYILDGKDVLGIMPTGAGKSICYQVPCMIFDGITIVISPLISLMKDQVDSLNEVGIPATFVNSTLSYRDYEQTIENIYNNVYKIVYVAPERLNSETFLNLLNKINISMITIDEAHCVSQWGHDFRPSYREIANVILNLNKRPIISAFTATATQIVKDDIIKLLHLNNPFCLTTGFDRKNLKFEVQTPSDKEDFILDYIGKHKEVSGIIYCSTRKTVDSLYEKINSHEFSVTKYHAGMSENNRQVSQNNFTYDRCQIMVATNAFGMGIDKSNIRYVIHFNMPKDLESYYQEAGRAGRDGENSECILLFSRADIVTNKFLIESIPNVNHSLEYSKLNDMIDYCNTDKCLRRYILEYFGEHPDFKTCNNCSNCLSDISLYDITIDSQKILSCIKRMNGSFGSNLITDVLKGSNTAKIRKFGFDRLSTYGIMNEYSKDTIKDLIYFLVTEGYLKTVGNKFPTLALTKASDEVLFKNKQIFIKKKIEKLSLINNPEEFDYDENLFKILRDLRMEIASKNQIPPFIVFSDTSLKQMAKFYPTSSEKMLSISGVGLNKLEKYGTFFIEEIKKYVKENNISIQDIDYNLKPQHKLPTSSHEPKPEIKEDTRITTYNLYKERKNNSRNSKN